MSARDHFMRASTYHRTAEYYAEADPEVLAECGRRSRACFEAAAALFDPPVEPLSIAFESGFLPGYLVRAPGRDRPPGAGPGAPWWPSGASTRGPRRCTSSWARPAPPGAGRSSSSTAPARPAACGRNPTMTYRPDYEAPVGAVLDDVERRRADGRRFRGPGRHEHRRVLRRPARPPTTPG